LGGNSQLSWRITPQITWNLGANYTRGRILVGDSTTPLDHIPPFQWSSDLNYHVGKIAIWGQFYSQGKKDIRDYLLNGEDNEQYAPSGGMPAWMVVHLKCRVSFVKGFVLQGGIENVFDTQYRVFASGINAPGRNFQISLRKSF
jgi:hemoglobin/transferrin/lactoferrin receptor protein